MRKEDGGWSKKRLLLVLFDSLHGRGRWSGSGSGRESGHGNGNGNMNVHWRGREREPEIAKFVERGSGAWEERGKEKASKDNVDILW